MVTTRVGHIDRCIGPFYRGALVADPDAPNAGACFAAWVFLFYLAQTVHHQAIAIALLHEFAGFPISKDGVGLE
jgi:hypothetical protein